MKPYFKYTGGKTRELKNIRPYVPTTVRRIVEPFCGSCAVAFDAEKPAIVGDLDDDVINLLQGRLDEVGGAMFARPATGQNENTGEIGQLLHGRWRSRVRGFPEYMGMLPASCMAEEMECTGKDAIRGLKATLPIPPQTEFIPGSARPAKAQASLDGLAFADVPLRRKATRDGQAVEEAVPWREYRALRWAAGDLGAGSSLTFTIRVRVIEERN